MAARGCVTSAQMFLSSVSFAPLYVQYICIIHPVSLSQDVCVKAYLALRHHTNLLIILFSMMLMTGTTSFLIKPTFFMCSAILHQKQKVTFFLKILEVLSDSDFYFKLSFVATFGRIQNN